MKPPKLLQACLFCAVALGTVTALSLRAAAFSDANWTTLGSGMNRYVNWLAASGSDLYAGGAFTNAGGNSANRVAKWNGSSWSALGSGMDAAVWALEVLGSNVYAGGDFTNAGGVVVNHVAKWDGSSWSALGNMIHNHAAGVREVASR